MAAEVVDTNVLVVGSALEGGWGRPRVPTDDVKVLRKVAAWLAAFRADATRHLVMDFPLKTILDEYKKNLVASDYGRRVVQHKFDTGALRPVEVTYWENARELVAELPLEVKDLIHDIGDHKMVAAAFGANAPIFNATDSDWTDPKVVQALDLLCLRVVQLLTGEELAACKKRGR